MKPGVEGTARPSRCPPGPALDPPPASAGLGHPSHPGSAQRAARAVLRAAPPLPFLLAPPPRPHGSGLPAGGRGRRLAAPLPLRPRLARTLRPTTLPPVTVSPKDPAQATPTRARKRGDRPAFRSSDATTEARTRNRARAAARALPGPRAGFRCGRQRSLRLTPAPGSRLWLQGSLSACVFSATAGVSRF